MVEPSGAFFELDGQHIGGRQTYPLHVASSDAGAGITDINIEHRGWPGPPPPLADHPVKCDPHHRTPGLDARICRRADAIDIDVDTRSMPEGTRRFLAYSPDVAGNVGKRTWTVIIDRTPPTPPTNLRFTAPEEGSAQAAWDAADDPVLPDGTPGSGVAHYRERHRVGDGEWSQWTTFDDVTRLGDEVYDQPAGTHVDFEVEAIDAVGNVSDVARIGGEVYGSPPHVGLSGRLAELDGRYVGSEQLRPRRLLYRHRAAAGRRREVHGRRRRPCGQHVPRHEAPRPRRPLAAERRVRSDRVVRRRHRRDRRRLERG